MARQPQDLEAAWRSAEEIAAIADPLTIPERVRRAFLRWRRGSENPAAG